MNADKITEYQMVVPEANAGDYVAWDQNYTALMHFAPCFVEAMLRGTISNDIVRDAHLNCRIGKAEENLS